MIGVNMASAEGVTLAAAGKYCAEDIRVVPDFPFAPQARRWTLEIASEISGTTVTFLSSDEWLKENRNSESLNLFLHPNFATDHSSLKALQMVHHTNKKDAYNCYGDYRFYSTSAGQGRGNMSFPINSSATWDTNLFNISADGELTFKITNTAVIVPGNYTLIAWL